jgi:hypothetical protein
MAKSSPRPANPIDALLEERDRFQTWLTRLDEAGSTAPPAVRARIRGDYQQRLDQVVEQLRSHAAAVAEQLASLRVQQADLTQRELEAQETLAEAELRHAVGEYEESEWERVRGGSERLLIDVREELARVSDEIARLGEVQGLIAGPPPPPPVAAKPTLPGAPAPAPVEDDGSDWEPDIPLADTPAEKSAPVIPSAPRFTPRSGSKASEATPPRTLPFPGRSEASPDDLAFIKSMADETPAPRRSSGASPRVSDAGSKPSEPPPAGDRPSQAAAPKTLKCGECGTLNRPTEWYCERCGAELAAL